MGTPVCHVESYTRTSVVLQQKQRVSHLISIISEIPPELLQIIRPPFCAPSALPLNLGKEFQYRPVLCRVAHAPPRDPERLDAVRPRSMMVVGH